MNWETAIDFPNSQRTAPDAPESDPGTVAVASNDRQKCAESPDEALIEKMRKGSNRRAKFYALTAKGRRQLAVETGKWDKLVRAIAQILRPGEQEEA